MKPEPRELELRYLNTEKHTEDMTLCVDCTRNDGPFPFCLQKERLNKEKLKSGGFTGCNRSPDGEKNDITFCVDCSRVVEFNYCREKRYLTQVTGGQFQLVGCNRGKKRKKKT